MDDYIGKHRAKTLSGRAAALEVCRARDNANQRGLLTYVGKHRPERAA